MKPGTPASSVRNGTEGVVTAVIFGVPDLRRERKRAVPYRKAGRGQFERARLPIREEKRMNEVERMRDAPGGMWGAASISSDRPPNTQYCRGGSARNVLRPTRDSSR